MYGQLLLLLIFSALWKLPVHELLLGCAVPMQQSEAEASGIMPPTVSPLWGKFIPFLFYSVLLFFRLPKLL